MAYTSDEIKKKMQANSEAWHSADAATKKKLEAENQSLGKQLGASYNSSTGTWSDSSGSKLYNVNSGSSNKKTSSGSSNKNTTTSTTTTTTKPTGTVTTNTSYNGDYLDVNLDTDYQQLINDSIAKGDYSSAAAYEALRNAKINYLNSTTGTTYEPTYNYVSEYGSKNNQGGTVYTASKTIIDMVNGSAGTYNINGTVYKKDADGSYYVKTGADSNGAIFDKIGDGYNAETGEFTFSDPEEAKQEYLQQMVGVGVASPNDTFEDLAAQGKVSNSYLEALLSGLVGNYTNTVINTGKEPEVTNPSILGTGTGTGTNVGTGVGGTTGGSASVNIDSLLGLLDYSTADKWLEEANANAKQQLEADYNTNVANAQQTYNTNLADLNKQVNETDSNFTQSVRDAQQNAYYAGQASMQGAVGRGMTNSSQAQAAANSLLYGAGETMANLNLERNTLLDNIYTNINTLTQNHNIQLDELEKNRLAEELSMLSDNQLAYLDKIMAIDEYNATAKNNYNAMQTEMAWQSSEAQKDRDFNSAEAEKDRNHDIYMQNLKQIASNYSGSGSSGNGNINTDTLGKSPEDQAAMADLYAGQYVEDLNTDQQKTLQYMIAMIPYGEYTYQDVVDKIEEYTAPKPTIWDKLNNAQWELEFALQDGQEELQNGLKKLEDYIKNIKLPDPIWSIH